MLKLKKIKSSSYSRMKKAAELSLTYEDRLNRQQTITEGKQTTLAKQDSQQRLD